MRFIPVVLIIMAAATSAGCFGKDDGKGGDPPTTTTPTGTATTPTSGPTPTGTPTPTPGGNGTTPPAKPAPKSLCTVAGTFQDNVQPGPPPTNTKSAACGAVPAGYTKAVMNVTFSSAQPAWVTEGVSIALVDSTGAAAATCEGPSAPAQSAPMSVTCEGAVTAGEYTLVLTGAGNIDVAGDVQIS